MKKQNIFFSVWIKQILLFLVIIVIFLGFAGYTILNCLHTNLTEQKKTVIQTVLSRSADDFELTVNLLEEKIKNCIQSEDKKRIEQVCKDEKNLLFVYSPETSLNAASPFINSHPDTIDILELWCEKNISSLKKAETQNRGTVLVENFSPMFHQKVIVFVFPVKINEKSFWCLAGVDTALFDEIKNPPKTDTSFWGELSLWFTTSSKVTLLCKEDSFILEAKNPPSTAVLESSKKPFFLDSTPLENEKDILNRQVKVKVIMENPPLAPAVFKQFRKSMLLWLIPLVFCALLLLFCSATIAASVNRRLRKMNRILAENEAENQYAFSFVNRSAVTKLRAKELVSAGVKRNSTVLWATVRNLDELTATEDAAEKIELLNLCFSNMQDALTKTGGTLDNYFQNSLFSVWGSVATTGTPASDAWNAVRAALLMRVAQYEINEKRKKESKKSVHFSYGIASDCLCAGVIGSVERKEYSVLGNGVKLAKELDALNKDFNTDILISQSTYDLVKKRVIVEKMTTQQGQTLYAVINAVGIKGPANLKELQAFLSS